MEIVPAKKQPMELLDLPNIILIEIMEYCTYDEVAKKRMVCIRFDQICQHILNRGFNKAISKHSHHFKRIKAILPRRESNRRTHILARHCDILTSVETRLSMLTMTYTKYIDLKLCCFIPGRVLDEIFRILRIIEKPDRHLRPHEVLQELRDISSMAIEHFDENIQATLKPFWDLETRAEARRVSAANTAAIRAGNNNQPYEAICQRINSLVSLGEEANLGKIIKSSALLPNTGGGGDARGSTGGGAGRGDEGGAGAILAKPSRDGSTILEAFDRLEDLFRKGIAELKTSARIQKRQNRRMQKMNTFVTELNMQMFDMKKRFEDVEAKNEELLAKIKHFYNGDPPTTSADAAAAAAAVAAAMAAMDCSTLNTAAKRRHDDPVPADNAMPTLEPLALPPALAPLSSVATAMEPGDTEVVAKKPKL